jgi:hypothetical protein
MLGLSVCYNGLMASVIYESEKLLLIDGTAIYAAPLKIKYLREFMLAFEDVKNAKGDHEAISCLAECARISMQQYYPKIVTIEDLEDSVDLPTIYSIIDAAAGIKINEKSEAPVKDQATQSGSSWKDLDLAKLESEAFLIGIWKDYDDLEKSLSMPELLATLEAKRELDYQEKKFLAAIQGVDLDKQSGKQNEWEALKSRVFSKGKAQNENDILAYQGSNAQKNGFGIGLGLDYEDLTKK